MDATLYMKRVLGFPLFPWDRIPWPWYKIVSKVFVILFWKVPDYFNGDKKKVAEKCLKYLMNSDTCLMGRGFGNAGKHLQMVQSTWKCWNLNPTLLKSRLWILQVTQYCLKLLRISIRDKPKISWLWYAAVALFKVLKEDNQESGCILFQIKDCYPYHWKHKLYHAKLYRWKRLSKSIVYFESLKNFQNFSP